MDRRGDDVTHAPLLWCGARRRPEGRLSRRPPIFRSCSIAGGRDSRCHCCGSGPSAPLLWCGLMRRCADANPPAPLAAASIAGRGHEARPAAATVANVFRSAPGPVGGPSCGPLCRPMFPVPPVPSLPNPLEEDAQQSGSSRRSACLSSRSRARHRRARGRHSHCRRHRGRRLRRSRRLRPCRLTMVVKIYDLEFLQKFDSEVL